MWRSRTLYKSIYYSTLLALSYGTRIRTNKPLGVIKAPPHSRYLNRWVYILQLISPPLSQLWHRCRQLCGVQVVVPRHSTRHMRAMEKNHLIGSGKAQKVVVWLQQKVVCTQVPTPISMHNCRACHPLLRLFCRPGTVRNMYPYLHRQVCMFIGTYSGYLLHTA